jgi:hypothetical protein
MDGWRRGLIRAGAVALALAAGCGDPGGAPRIADPGPQVAVVGQELVVLVQAADPDGDALDYAFASLTLPRLDDAAEIAVSPDGRALFTWTPVAGDLGAHVIELVVTDGTYEVSLSMPVEVRGAGEGSEPVFVEPVGEGFVYDLADGPCVPSVSITVDDPDDAAIELRQLEPILASAELTVAPDGRQGLWDWCPSAAQQAAAGAHELVLAADDGESTTLKRLSIWLERDGVACPCACEDDDGEDDDDLAQALGNEPVPEGTLADRRLCPLDEDWVRIEVPARARVRALLSGSLVPDMALELSTADGSPVALAATAGTSMEEIDSECLEPGSYALRVFSPQDDAAGDYQLSHVLDVAGC